MSSDQNNIAARALYVLRESSSENDSMLPNIMKKRPKTKPCKTTNQMRMMVPNSGMMWLIWMMIGPIFLCSCNQYKRPTTVVIVEMA